MWLTALSVLLAVAPGTDLQVKAAIPVLLKVLTYDVNFDSRGAGPFTVLVVSETDQGLTGTAVVSALADSNTKVKARPVRWVSVEFKDDAQLQTAIDHSKAGALLLVPGMAAASVKSAWAVAQENQLYALALEAAMVEQGVPIGLTMADGRPQIMINERSVNAIGARFETSVLKNAKIIRGQVGIAVEGGPLQPAQEFNDKMTPPAKLSGPDPEYNQKALDREVQGTMKVKCVVGVDGHVSNCRVLKSLPFLDGDAINALVHRIYTPALLGGRPVEVDYTFTIPFTLPE